MDRTQAEGSGRPFTHAGGEDATQASGQSDALPWTPPFSGGQQPQGQEQWGAQAPWSQADPQPGQQSPWPAAAPQAGQQTPWPQAGQQAGQQFPQIPVATKKRGGRIALVGALVVGLVAVGLGGWFVLGNLAGGGASSKDVAAIADFSKEPEEAWTASMADQGALEWVDMATFTLLEADAAVVTTRLNYTTFGEKVGSNSAWYEGYDEHYAAGLESGRQYTSDRRAYFDSIGGTYPDSSSYFPQSYGSDFDQASEDPKFVGWFDGWYDGQNTTATMKKTKPDIPTLGAVSVLDLKSGDIRWSVELATLGVTPSTYAAVYATGGKVVVAVPGETNSSGRTQDNTVTLNVLAGDSGKTEASETVPGRSMVALSDYSVGKVLDLPIIIENSSYTGEPGDESTMAAYAVTDLTTPLWENVYSGTMEWGFVDDLLRISDSDVSEMVDPKTGESPEWSVAEPTNVQLRPFAGGAIRTEWLQQGSYAVVSRIDPQGKTKWEVDLDSFSMAGEGDGLVLFETEQADGSISGIRRLDLDTGQPMWEDFESVTAYSFDAAGDSILALDDSRTFVLDAKTGERKATIRGRVDHHGAKTLYTRDETGRMTAWDYEGEKLWDMRLRETQDLVGLPGRGIVIDTERKQVTAWR